MISAIPEPHRAAVARALSTVFGDRTLDGLSLIQGGLSSALVYRAVIAGQPYLLRVATRIDAFSDPARHHACLQSAAEAGLAPRVLHADTHDAITITDFIAAEPLSACPRGVLLDQLASLLVRLRGTARFPPLVDYVEGVDGFVAEVRNSGLLPPLELFARYAAIAAAYPRVPGERISAHNDLNPGNLLWDGRRLWIIDWEAAFANDPYVDLAQVCNFYARSDDQEAQLVTAVLGAPPDEAQAARLWLMRQIAHMFYATSVLRIVRAHRPSLVLSPAELAAPPLGELYGNPALMRSPDGQLRYALSLLAEIDRETQSPRLARALQIVQR